MYFSRIIVRLRRNHTILRINYLHLSICNLSGIISDLFKWGYNTTRYYLLCLGKQVPWDVLESIRLTSYFEDHESREGGGGGGGVLILPFGVSLARVMTASAANYSRWA